MKQTSYLVRRDLVYFWLWSVYKDNGRHHKLKINGYAGICISSQVAMLPSNTMNKILLTIAQLVKLVLPLTAKAVKLILSITQVVKSILLWIAQAVKLICLLIAQPMKLILLSIVQLINLILPLITQLILFSIIQPMTFPLFLITQPMTFPLFLITQPITFPLFLITQLITFPLFLITQTITFPLFLIAQSMTFPLFLIIQPMTLLLFPIAQLLAFPMLIFPSRPKRGTKQFGSYMCPSEKKAHNRKKEGEKKVIDVETYEASATQVDPDCWIEPLILLVSEKRILESEEWLTAPIINASQFILASLRETYMAQDSKMFAARWQWISWLRRGQILHEPQGHWLTISNLGAKNSEVFVYDSLYSSCSSNVQQQIACLLKADRPNIELRFVDVHKQSGGSDCGAFAIAYATTPCLGKLSGKFVFDQTVMRQHLLKCLEMQHFTMFPVRSERRQGGRIQSRQ